MAFTKRGLSYTQQLVKLGMMRYFNRCVQAFVILADKCMQKYAGSCSGPSKACRVRWPCAAPPASC